MVIEMRKKVFQRGLQAGAFMVPSIWGLKITGVFWLLTLSSGACRNTGMLRYTTLQGQLLLA
jgi:hypothetical protein